MPGHGQYAGGARVCAVLVTLLLVAATSQRLSAQDPSGSWDVRWAQAIRIERDGTIEIQRWGDAELVLELQGERVTGTWTTSVLETVQWRLAGSLQAGHLVLEATEHDSSNEELAILERILWDATVTAEGIEGNVSLVLRARPGELVPRPFTAVRTGGR